MTGLKRRLAETEAQQRSQRDTEKLAQGKRRPRDVDQIIREVLKDYKKTLTENKLTYDA